MNVLKQNILAVIIYIISNQMYCQSGNGEYCIIAEPLCGSSQFSFPNTSGFNLAENEPDYGCLIVQANPSWFYLQIAQSGDIQLMIEQSTISGGTPDLDVDFIIYGPFNDPRSPCTSDLKSGNIIDCSFEIDFVEFVDIGNTMAGEFYLLLITNFSFEPGFITVTQTSGTATTNCVFLEDPIIIDEVACEGDDLTLDATTTNATHYIWYEDDGSGTGNYDVIIGATMATYMVVGSDTYKVEAFDINNVLLEKYVFNVMFFQTPVAPPNIQDYIICDTVGDNDGIGEFDLSTMDIEILNGLNPSDFSISYYGNASDANSGSNPLPILYTNNTATEIVYARIDNIATSDIGCFDIGTFNIKVNLLPEIDLEDEYILCVNTNGTEEILTPPIIDTGLDTLNYSFVWFLNDIVLPSEIGNTIMPLQDGIYSVEVTSLITTCSITFNTLVRLSAPPTISASVSSLAFSDNHTVEATAIGFGLQEHEFSLDNGPWQDNGTFNDVSFGEHIISARGINGCGESNTTVMVIDYPLYFTPNDDGYNDSWNIVGLSNQLQAKIYVFDRYGKLLKQLSPTGLGWDGTYNGAIMPANDYWFAVEYTEPRDGSSGLFKAHFSLKR